MTGRGLDPEERYGVVAVVVTPEAAEAVTNFLWEIGAVGVVEEADAALLVLRAFFPPSSHGREIEERLTDYLSALRQLAVAVGPGTVEVARVTDERWEEAWRSHFRPLPVGQRLLVCPPWDVPPTPPRPAQVITVIIEPGRAFGTGDHATTRGCLELLERTLSSQRIERVLDVGTGSGILAIAAARLGVPDVSAIDPDPDAVRAAQENARRNGVQARVRVTLESVAERAGPAVDLVLANLLGSMLVTHAPTLSRACRVPGHLIAGGLLVHEVPVVVASFVVEGFRMVEMTEEEGWAALLLVRDAAAGCGGSSSSGI